MNQGLYNYFIRENSLSSTPKPSVYYDYLTAQQIIDDTLGSKYPLECEFLAIKNFCYGAILNGIKAKVALKAIKKDYNDFLKSHPSWYKNKYMISLSMKRRMFLFFLKYKMFFALKVFSKLHQKFSK